MEARTDTDRLAEQIGWVRRLAHGLVADPHLAEDLVQETWLAFLRARPDTSRPLEPWFARVLTNFARRARRGDSRRAARESEAAREEALPSSADVYERAALHRELVGAVLALDEPYRGTLLLRFVDELPPREIAKRQGVPVRTVNTRLRRGLGQLRAKLDRDHEHDRERWLGCLVAFAQPKPVESATVLLPWVAALLLASAVVAIVVLEAEYSSDSAVGSIATPEPGSDAAAPGLASVESESAREPHGLAPAIPRRAWTGRVIDGAGLPVADALVELEAPARSRFGRFDPPVEVAPTKLGDTRTDEAGRFSVRAALEGEVELRVVANEFVTATISLAADQPLRTETELVVRLERAAKLRGRVVHAGGGAAHGGIVVLARARSSRDADRATRTEDDGTWILESVVTGAVVVEALDDACGARVSDELELVAGQERSLELVLEATPRIRGRVFDAASGRAAGFVPVGLEGQALSFGATDAAGAFELAAPGAFSRVTLRVGGAGFATERFVFDPLPPEGAELSIGLVPGRSAHGTVVDVDGTPLAGVFVSAVADEWRDGEHLHDRIVGHTDLSGRFALRGLRRELAHTLLAARAGRAALEAEFPRDERELDDVDLGVVRLALGGAAAGRVVDEFGAPRAGVELVLFRLGPRGTTSQSASPGLFAAGRVFARTTSAATGRFEFQDLPESAWLLAAGADATRERVTTEFDLAAGERVERELVAARGLSLVGRILDAAGALVENAAIVATSLVDARDVRGAYSRADGSFELVGLASGEHSLSITPPAERALAPARAVALAPADGLELRLTESARLAGHAFAADGSPLVFARIEGRDELGFPLTPTWTDRGGAFVLRAPRGRALELVAFTSRETAEHQRRADADPCATLHVAAERPLDATVELRATR